MKFISYTNDGRVAIQHAALILSKLDEADTLELHTMDNAIILLKKDMTRAETRDVLQGMVRLARSMTLDALCNSDTEDKTPLVDESVDDEYEDTITIPVPLEAFGDAGLLGKDLHIQVIDGAVVITEDILIAGLMVFKDHALLGLGLMLSAGEIPRIAGAFGLDTTTRANIMSAVYTAQAAVNTTRTVVQAVAK